ncbi:MAG TPA: fibronectin type III domain-containing protein [Acidimicrobiales bacterium]|nr:fibronectin type III domain-containing protein [Acidimicrobiales bacterium]
MADGGARRFGDQAARPLALFTAVVACTLTLAGNAGGTGYAAPLSHGDVLAATSQRIPAAPQCRAPKHATCANLTYHGGSVMLRDHNYLIFWGPHRSFSSGYVTYLEEFFRDIEGSGYLQNLTQYYMTPLFGSREYISNDSTLAGVVSDTAPIPDNCGSHCVNEDQVEGQIKDAIQAENWSATTNNLFWVFLPKDEGTCGNFFFITYSCFPNSDCAYHDNSRTLILGGDVIFAVVPYLGSAGADCSTGFQPSGNAVWDDTASVAAHEMIEAITDPNGDAWHGSGSNDEVADKCAWNFVDPNDVLPYYNSSSSGSDPQANEYWGGHYYAIQDEWDNAAPLEPDGTRCVSSVFPYAPIPLVVNTATSARATVTWANLLSFDSFQSPNQARLTGYRVSVTDGAFHRQQSLARTATQATFTGLPPGRATFQVTADNKYGGQPASIQAVIPMTAQVLPCEPPSPVTPASYGEPGYDEPATAPPALYINCGAVHPYQWFSRLTWSSWGATSAVGQGDYTALTCKPSCATGGAAYYPVVLRLSGPRLIHGYTQELFSLLNIQFTKGVPAYRPAWTALSKKDYAEDLPQRCPTKLCV